MKKSLDGCHGIHGLFMMKNCGIGVFPPFSFYYCNINCRDLALQKAKQKAKSSGVCMHSLSEWFIRKNPSLNPEKGFKRTTMKE